MVAIHERSIEPIDITAVDSLRDPIVAEAQAPAGPMPLGQIPNDLDRNVLATGLEPSVRPGRADPVDTLTALLTSASVDFNARAEGILTTQTTEGGWKDRPQRRHPSYTASVLNHTALATLLNSGALDPAVSARASQALQRSWRYLDAQHPHASQDPLPTSVLKRAEPMVRNFHGAVADRSAVAARNHLAIETVTSAMLAPGDESLLRTRALQILSRQNADGSWMDGSRLRHDASVLNHTALVAVLKSGAFRQDATLTAKLENGVLLSWSFLSEGKLRDPATMLGSLPPRVIAKADRMVGGFHRTIAVMEAAAPEREVAQPRRAGPAIRQGRSVPIDAITTSVLTPHEDIREQALQVLDTQNADGSWKDRPEHMYGTRNASVLNHTALVSILKSGALANDTDLTTKLELSLLLSWTHLNAGKLQDPRKMLEPLPTRVLAGTEPIAAQFHRAVTDNPSACLCALHFTTPSARTIGNRTARPCLRQLRVTC